MNKYKATYEAIIEANDKDDAKDKLLEMLEETINFNEDRGLDLLVDGFALEEVI